MMLFSACIVLNGQEAIFYEDFNGGIPDTWIIGPGEPAGAVWQWKATPFPDSAVVNGVPTRAWITDDFPAMISPSDTNGVVIFHSDVYNSGGISEGMGAFPGSNGHLARLTSPSFDCSGLSTVSVKFNQYAVVFEAERSTFLEVSIDGGNTWVDAPINEEIVDVESSGPESVEIANISSIAAGESDVRIRFVWDGLYYFWMIDDVEVIESPQADLELGTFLFPLSSYASPESQISSDTMLFEALISNHGVDTMTNVVLRANVFNLVRIGSDVFRGEDLYTDSLVLDALPPGYQDSVFTLNGRYSPELSTGEYAVEYEVFSLDDADFNPSDNRAVVRFEVSETIYSKDDDIYGGQARPNDDVDYQVGNLYYTSPGIADGDISAVNAILSVAKNEVDGSIGGETVTIFLYKVKDEVFPSFANFDTESDESLEIVGFGNHNFSSDYENFSEFTVPLLDAFTVEPGIALEADARYLITASYEGSARTINQNFDTGIEYFQISTVVKTSRWFLGGFGEDLAAVLRLQIQLNTTTSVDDQLLPQDAVTIYPNPVKEQLNIGLKFEQPSEGIIYIADMSGKVLAMREFNNLQNEIRQFNVQDWAAGQYMIRVRTQDGVSNQNFIKVN